jgi:hypothetical protein
MDDHNSANNRVGETIAKIDGVSNVTIVDEDDDEYLVGMPDGSTVVTASDGIEQLEMSISKSLIGTLTYTILCQEKSLSNLMRKI